MIVTLYMMKNWRNSNTRCRKMDVDQYVNILLKGWKLQRFPPIVNEDDKGVIDRKMKKESKKVQNNDHLQKYKVKKVASVYKENAELWFLAEKGDIEAIKYMLKDELQNIVYDRKFCYQISKGETALHIAAKNGHKGLTEFLISKNGSR